MAKTKQQKAQLLEKYKKLLKNSGGYFVVNTDGLPTPTITTLKKKLAETNCSYTVVKNTLFKIALQETKAPVATIDFKDPTAVITYSEDATVTAKLIDEVQKETKLMKAKYGFVDEKFLTGDKVMQLAEIPTREELLSKLLGSITSPLKDFMHCSTSHIGDFTRVLNGISKQME